MSHNNKIYKILLVEDEQNIRLNIKAMLELEDFIVTAVEDAEAALEEMEIRQLDLIITDIMLHNISGFELLEKIRSHEIYSQIPVIMVTAKPEKDLHGKLEHTGNYYLAKPFSYQALLSKGFDALSL